MKNVAARRLSEQEASRAWFRSQVLGRSRALLCRRPGSHNAADRELERRLGAAWMALGAGEEFAGKEALR